MPGPVEFWMGNEAIVAGALAAGANFYAGYPITPSSEIAELAARRLPAHGGTYLQMEDEIASIGAVIGASLAGARAFTATSGPGFSLMQENLGLAYMAEVPCVVVDVQRSGPSTGLATRPGQGDIMQARWGTHGDVQPVVLCPSTVEQCYGLTHLAFHLSERLRMPILVLSDEIVGHLREGIAIDQDLQPVERKFPSCSPASYKPYQAGPDGVPPLAAFGSEYVFHVTGSMHDYTGFPTADPQVAARKNRRLLDKVELIRGELSELHRVHETDGGNGRRITIFSYGASVRACREGGSRLSGGGCRVTIVELQCVWPFPDDVIQKYGSDADVVMVAEMNLGQVRRETERALPGVRVHGVHRVDGEPITPGDIISAVRGL